ncbi:glycosyltransferase family 2 protein [Limosilactobacillus sp.]|uniref:glycosyltransferase family 2 protein n=1 Tax=Limosilactobacillus sp. TaxID=2773925 RepID=UPI00345E235C
MPQLTIVVPAYNEEEVLPSTLERLIKIEDQMKANGEIDYGSNILVVSDGSTDQTWQIVKRWHEKTSAVDGLQFSRNFGHQQALLAGMKAAVDRAYLVITIDADLQDDPDCIPQMISDYRAGSEIVYGVRNNRQSDSWFKRNSAEAYYGLLKHLGVDLVADSADFRMMDARAVHEFLKFSERNLFIRGMVPKLGFKTAKVYYKRTPRQAGTSKYPLKKMLALAWNGITSLTVVPLRMILWTGAVACLLAVLMGIYSIVGRLAGISSFGWSPLMISLWLIGGTQLMSIGLVGEYVGKVMVEVKHRPRYIVQSRLF